MWICKGVSYSPNDTRKQKTVPICSKIRWKQASFSSIHYYIKNMKHYHNKDYFLYNIVPAFLKYTRSSRDRCPFVLNRKSSGKFSGMIPLPIEYLFKLKDILGIAELFSKAFSFFTILFEKYYFWWLPKN